MYYWASRPLSVLRTSSYSPMDFSFTHWSRRDGRITSREETERLFPIREFFIIDFIG